MYDARISFPLLYLRVHPSKGTKRNPLSTELQFKMLSSTAVFVVLYLLPAYVLCKSGDPAYEKVGECITKASESLKENGPKIKDQPDYKLKLCAHYNKVMRSCLAEPVVLTGSGEILAFVRTYYWQIGILEKETGVFSDVEIDKLKSLVEKSEIMEREGIESMENDPPLECAGNIYKQCIVGGERTWEEHANELALYTDFMDCLQRDVNPASPCEGPMRDHMVALAKAFEDHLWQNKSELAKVLANIQNTSFEE